MERWREVHLRRAGSRQDSGEADHARSARHGSEEPARASPDDQAESVQRERASARCSAALSAQDHGLIHQAISRISMAETKTPEFAGTGRRKTADARVRLATGSGKV